MGLFSKKRRVTVGVTAVGMVDKIESPFKQTVLTSVFAKRNITELIKEEAKNGFKSRTESYYRYGKNRYILGLPEGFKNYSNIRLGDISTVLSRILSQTVVTNFAKVSFADPLYFGYRALQEQYLFEPSTMMVRRPPVIYPPNTKVKALNTVIEDSGVVRVDVEIQKPALVSTDPLPPKEFTRYNLPFTMNLETIYLQVKYQLPDDVLEDTFRYWWYPVNTNTYPELETVIKEGYESPFYPMVPIRQNKVNVIDNNSTLKRDVKKMLKYLGIELSVITDAIMSTKDGNDPSNIDECFIGFFANLSSTRSEVALYLWEFFYDLMENQKVTKEIFTNWNQNRNGRDTPQESITIQENDFNIRLLWNYIDVETKPGVIGPVGSAVMSTTTKPRFILGDLDFEESKLVITKQINSVAVSELVVHGLEHLTDVYEGSLHSVTLEDLTNDDKKGGFFIPLNQRILKRLRPADQHIVLMEGLTMVLYAVQISYVRWYQRSLFKNLIKIVAIVLAVYSFGWSNLLTQGFTWATAATILTDVIVSIIIMEGLELIVSMIGGELAAIIAAVTAVYALAKGDFTSMETLFADDLLQMANMTFAASNKLTLKEYNKLMVETSDLIKSVKEKQEEIKEAYDLLGKHDIDFFDIQRGGFYFNANETPDDLFNRMVHTKNPATLMYDHISYFYENALKSLLTVKEEF